MLTTAIVCGFLLDLVLGDPAWMPHPVVMIGRWISHLERMLRRTLPQTERGELFGGIVLVVCVVLGVFAAAQGIYIVAAWIHPILAWMVQVVWCWQALAAKGLADESLRVYRCLVEAGSLADARRAVARIVGRDTEGLSREGVVRATVETVAENYSDGVFAPLFYLAVGGAPLGLAYKAVNTMDSMLGYQNERYLYFGRAAARLDDAAGYVPSRIAALFLIVSAPFAGGNAKNAWRIWRRDRRNHASPNAAQTEAACAGALGVQLAGPASYFGKRYDKPFIGDAVRQIDADDILAAVKMMYAASVLSLFLVTAVRFLAALLA